MTHYDQQVLFTALAFVTVLLQDGDNLNNDSARKIKVFAGLLGQFCAENVARSAADLENTYIDDTGAAKIDAAISQHLEDVRKDKTTHLPEDREPLIQLYDRLQQRKSRRMQWQLHAKATKEKLADLILHYLDEEIEDAEVQS